MNATHWQLARVLGEQAKRANVFKQIGLARRFRTEAEAAVALDPKQIDARRGLIVFYIHAPGIVGGDRKKADLMAEEIGRIDPAAGFLARAVIIEETESPADREPLYRQAADAAKTPRLQYEAHGALMNVYLSGTAPKYELAEREARELVKIDPRRSGGYSGLAVVYASGGRWADLDALLADAERAVPDNLNPTFQAGRVILARGSDHPRAERYFRKYLTQEPEIGTPTAAHAHWRLGLVLEKLGKRAEAIAEVERATTLKPDLEDARKDLSFALSVMSCRR